MHIDIMKGELAKGTKFHTPYYIVKGSTIGATVMVTAGVHGNETASVKAAKQFVHSLQQGLLHVQKGTLVIVPLVNQQAYTKRIRGVPDLNRTFPSRAHDKPRHPLSADLFRLAAQYRPAWYIDMHEANGLSRLNPKVLGQSLLTDRRSPTVKIVRQIVKRINRSIERQATHFTVRLRELSGSGRTAAARLLQAKAITVETSWSLSHPIRVKYQKNILRQLLKRAGLMH
ncbi:succinylglutamate desuccinylase/aspartoacylase domain-containing protein [Paenibacillus sp. OSY-SE]|uniref:succinylglutamate desuccinylase/aspartoacylase domain-containing protein n=1 Tax=Paenibacillus sp. OSY-SE TaxID=1196323 RepID=UPI000305B1B5|nr:succinylglutamate desuccinylase/aspartoacylase family protein [Paenibacillus sp. OSY-SE]